MDWLEGSGLEIDDGVVVDSSLHATDDVLAAGDVARWPDLRYGRTVRAEHWTNAAEQGRDRGSQPPRRPGLCRALRPVPYIWSDQYDVKIQVLGDPGPDDTVEVVDGSLDRAASSPSTGARAGSPQQSGSAGPASSWASAPCSAKGRHSIRRLALLAG